MSTVLGQGSYGEVIVRKGLAVKKFRKLSHIIQEYTALKFLNDCRFVVKVRKIDLANLELHMDLYDCSLRRWLEEQRHESEGIDKAEILKIFHDVILGLVELHDRGLAHGDLKPGNILIKKSPLKAVLGDCGFVSNEKYAKVERTAATYRDPVIDHDRAHDLFSLGICMLEIFGEIHIGKQANYNDLKQIVAERVKEKPYREIIYNLVHEDRERRPSARLLLDLLFKEDYPHWNSSFTNISSREITNPETIYDANNLRIEIKQLVFQYEINRGKKGFGALKYFLDTTKVATKEVPLYLSATLMILSSLFGKSGFDDKEALAYTKHKFKHEELFIALENLIQNHIFLGILLSPL